MKKLLFIIAFLFATVFTFAQDVYVQGYTRSNGTYVQGYYRTAPNSTRNDNYSTVGNVNPYTGTSGTQPRDGYTTTRTSSVNYSSPANYSTSSYSEPTYRNTYTPATYSAPTSTYSSPSYSSSRTIYTGSRGGQYYINSNGNKTYVSRN
jgi:hypothetical protein